jgi:EAL domain-containing protein (putative c-di-GMP-specific phosphodiesterase class I)
MYQAKKAGRNRLRFFDQAMQDSINARAALEGELRKAIERQEFQLYYQIQVDDAGQLLGAETLIRWVHHVRGIILPTEFIPLAEETGLILSIGQWALETACAQLKAWKKNTLTCGLALSVNVSAFQLHQADFVAQLKTMIQQYGINPTRLKLELTESMLLEDIEGIIATMITLKELGIQFSLDDFGTGYSSLQHLKRLPLYQLKIDQSFVRSRHCQQQWRSGDCTHHYCHGYKPGFEGHCRRGGNGRAAALTFHQWLHTLSRIFVR